MLPEGKEPLDVLLGQTNSSLVTPSDIPFSEKHDHPQELVIKDFSDGCLDSVERVMYCEQCGQPLIAFFGCNKRFKSQCPVCAKKWVRKERRAFERALAGMLSPKLLTLTLCKKKSIEDNLARVWEMRNALLHKIRYEGYEVRGWFAVIELPNHIHMVIDSEYIPQYELSTMWKGITGDSWIVDIRKIKIPRENAQRAIKYITKYLTKGAKTELPPEILKGFHMVGSWAVNRQKAPMLPLCECGESHGMRLLTGIDINGYLDWWANQPCLPPSAS